MTQTSGARDRDAVRRGRPAATSPRELEIIALRLFSTAGYDATTVDDIAAEAGVSSRTYFRYFDSKSGVLWHAFDGEVDALRTALAAVPPGTALLAAIRQAVVSVNHYTAADVPELRVRMHLISSVPALQTSAAPHYDAWEQVIIDYAAERLGEPAGALVPVALGRAALAVCRAAYEVWVNRADADLPTYLGLALDAMAGGFTASGADRR